MHKEPHSAKSSLGPMEIRISHVVPLGSETAEVGSVELVTHPASGDHHDAGVKLVGGDGASDCLAQPVAPAGAGERVLDDVDGDRDDRGMPRRLGQDRNGNTE